MSGRQSQRSPGWSTATHGEPSSASGDRSNITAITGAAEIID